MKPPIACRRLFFPESVVFSENVISVWETKTQTSDIRIDFADFSFGDDQELAESLTSQGLSITIAISADKQNLVGTRSDGEIMLMLLCPSANVISTSIRR
ncbi:hypothetical protein O9929_25095 [Vibrio lentus]|nr:hypothetical protein [Vibrio lentus]